jgi:hypothetical protein
MKFDYFKSSVSAFILVGLAALAVPAEADVMANRPVTVQPRESYEAAIHNYSTSPSYVMISIAGGETEQVKQVCTTANFLLGAIHREYGLGYSAADISKVAEIALASPDHTFRFRQPTALANIPLRYSDDDLAAARSFLAPISTDELRTRFSSLLRESRLSTDGYARDAIACALLERGLSPRSSDISGQVYIAR